MKSPPPEMREQCRPIGWQTQIDNAVNDLRGTNWLLFLLFAFTVTACCVLSISLQCSHDRIRELEAEVKSLKESKP